MASTVRTNGRQDGSRLRWMDLTRGAAIVLVILHHSIDIPAAVFDTPMPAALVVVDRVFAPFRIPLLMFLSGMLLPRSFRRTTGPYFAGKARGILWPYLVWSLVVLGVAGQLSFGALANVLFYPPTYLWYLWFLLVFYSVAWLLRRLSVPPLPAAAVALIASMFLPEDYRLSRFAFLLAFFLAGWWWAQAESRLTIRESVRRTVICCGLLLATVTAVLSAMGTATRYEVAFAWGTIALIVAVALGLPSDRPRRWAKPAEFVGRNSIVFYVSHYPVIFVLDAGLLPLLGPGHEWVVVLATLTTALAVGIVLSVARGRIPPVNRLFQWR